MNIKLSTGTSALTLMLAAFAPNAFAQGVQQPAPKPTLASLQAQITQLTTAFQAEHTARLAAETAEATTRAQAIAALTTSFNSLSTTVGAQATTLTGLQTSTTALQTTVTGYSTRVTALETKTQFMTVEDTKTIFSGTNVQIINGLASTDTLNGLGNLIVGYDEGNSQVKTGSHNLVVGPYHAYISYGGAVLGYGNTISGQYATIVGGNSNNASGDYSSIHGGFANSTSGLYSAIAGGYFGSATGQYSAIGGGDHTLEARLYGWSSTALHN